MININTVCASFSLHSGFTYFYKGKEYWKFNNQLLRVEPDYPRSILRDFLGCDDQTADHNWDQKPSQTDERHYDNSDVDIVIKLGGTGGTEKAVAIAIPCVLALCMMVLLYTIFQFRRKSTQRHSSAMRVRPFQFPGMRSRAPPN